MWLRRLKEGTRGRGGGRSTPFLIPSEKRCALVPSSPYRPHQLFSQRLWFSQQPPRNSNPNSFKPSNEENKLMEEIPTPSEPQTPPEVAPTPPATPTSSETTVAPSEAPTAGDGSPTIASDETTQKRKEKLERKENLRWKPGQQLTNSQLLHLFNSYSQKNQLPHADHKTMLQHPLLHVYGFDRREFIKGCKQALEMISKSISSPRFHAFTKGATHSCEESDFLQSVSSPEVFETWKGLTDATGYVNSFQSHFLGKLFTKFVQVEMPTFKITQQRFMFRQLEHISLAVTVKPMEGKSFGLNEENQLELIESSPLSNGEDDLSKSSKSSKKILKDVNEMNPDDLHLRVSMIICVRCQLTTSFQLDLDDDIPPDWASKSEDEWVYLYFHSYLDDFDWTIVKYATDSEYQQSSPSLHASLALKTRD